MSRLTLCLLTFTLLIGSISCGMYPPSPPPRSNINTPVLPPAVVPPPPRFVPRIELPKAPTPASPAVLPPRLQVAPKPPEIPIIKDAIKSAAAHKKLDVGVYQQGSGFPVMPSVARLARLDGTLIRNAIMERRLQSSNIPTTPEGLKKLYYEEIWNHPEQYGVKNPFTKGLRVQYGDPRIEELANARLKQDTFKYSANSQFVRLPKARELQKALAEDHLERIQVGRPLSSKYKGLTIRELGIDKDDQASWNSKVATEADVEKWIERQVHDKGQKIPGNGDYSKWIQGKDAPWAFGFGEAGRWKKAVNEFRQELIDKAMRQKNGIPAPMTSEEKQAKQLDDLDAQYAAQRQQQQQEAAAVKSGLDLDYAPIPFAESEKLSDISPKQQSNPHKQYNNNNMHNSNVHVFVNVF